MNILLWTLVGLAALVWTLYMRHLAHRVRWARRYLQLQKERNGRAYESVTWQLLGPYDAIKAQQIYQSRSGLPWWTLRLLECPDEPNLYGLSDA